MPPTMPLPSSRAPARLLFFAATLLFAAALGLACLLARQRLPGCGGAEDCATLAGSHWAHWGPVPVALPAIALYAAALGCLLALNRRLAAREGTVWTALVALSLVALGAAFWFAGLQGLVLHRSCPLCLATHLCAGAGSGLVLALAFARPAGDLRWRAATLAATGALLLLAGGQLLLPTRSGEPTAPAAMAHPSLVISPTLAAREVLLVNGRVRLHAADYPALASSSAPVTRMIAVMFDYTCEVCRANDALLKEGIVQAGRGGGGLGVLLIPTPLDPACNPAVDRLRPEHANACLYARYALAVWKAAPEQFAAYDAWLMAGGPAPPPIGAARAQAEALVGAGVFAKALARPEIDRMLHDAGQIYQTLEAGVIPKLLLPREVVAGGIFSPAQLQPARR